MKYTNSAKNDIRPDAFTGYTDMTSTFIMHELDHGYITEDRQDGAWVSKINKEELAEKLDYYFGNTIKYQCYSFDNWQGDETGVRIVFDTADKHELNQDNIIYNAKILCCLYKICNDVHMEKAEGSYYEQAMKDISSGNYDTIENRTIYTNLLGDADLNGEVGLSDLVAVSKYNINCTAYSLANETALANADVNNDGKVDSLDETKLIEYNLRKISEF